MKYRTDLVTNSNGSSFIVAHNNHFTEEQRNRLADFALKNFLGNITCSTEKELVEYFNEAYDLDFKVGEFTDENGNIKEIFDDSGYLKDEFVEDYSDYCTELGDFITCLEFIVQGKSINFGYIDLEYNAPAYTIKEMQRDFWNVLQGNNFDIIKDNL